ncbi:MAG: oxidoreductase [Hyphomonadaceae bacterium]|jgi:3-oxoacyl-[acyl-carrier protein] reductase|nr:oxidoreductase [Hyphomonadaceae bacterium]MBA28461.1 oxidoreductase [Hyphomonadaceae bacterium]|tara:strand:- start:312680 stop:313384 length:705 start_codon:yes stop_codon:yes gene_type:complete
MSSDKPVMIITGTRKGIGRFLSEHFLAEGWIVAGCSRGESDLQHENYRHFCLDVADEKAVTGMTRAITREFGRVDVLLNNAGIASMNHALLTPKSTLERIFQTNVFGTYLFCREAAKAMGRRKYGRIVNFATVATPLKLEGEAVYAASKAAVVSLTEVLAREFSGLGVTVNAVGPTPVPTDLVGSVPEEKMTALIARQAIPRYGEMRDVLNVIDFFIRPESDFVTGQTLYLGGV